jgi:Cu-Zn family superoxide dismutase
MKRIIASCFILTTAFIAIANIQAEDKKEHAHAKAHAELAPNGAFCRIRPTKDNKTFGQIRFVERNGVLHVTGRVRNLTKGEHGFHVHEFGDLRAPDATSAGGHYNPTNMEKHAGDLGVIIANEEGVAEVNIKTKELTVHSILGRSIIVHAEAGGPRVGGGVIGIAGPPAKKGAKKSDKKPAK